MRKISTIFCFVIGLLSANAQPNHNNRCEIRSIEDPARFEHWLHSKQIASGKLSDRTYKIPVVIHVLHLGEPVGEGFNYSAARIESQIRTLNEDFRRKEGTPGFNSHPDGGDPRIEFIMAQVDPDGNPTDGIVRVDMKSVHLPPGTGDIITACSQYSYWDPDQYLNIWCMYIGPPPILFFGSGRFPVSDLEGLGGQSADGDGVFINAFNFGQGETNTVPNYDKGRSLTHEMGHFLGLLHTFGSINNSRQCDQYSDYCDDTPPIPFGTDGCPSVRPAACDSRPAMIENYMDYSYDVCMNIFTRDQIARMHVVLENSPRRKSLLTSPAIDRSEDVTGIQDDIVHAFKIYPNPANDKLYISMDEKIRGSDIKVTAHTLLGKMVFKKTFKVIETEVEIPISDVYEKMMILTIEGPRSSFKQLVMIN